MELDAALRKGFRLGDWEVRPIEGLVTGAQGSHHLQPKTMDVLVCLAASPGQVVTRDELIDRVWNGSAVSDEPLTRCIHEIRRCLGDHRDEPEYIKTIPKRGYRLLAAVGDPQIVEEILTSEAVAETHLFWQVTRQRVLWVGATYAVMAWLFVQLVRFVESRASADLLPPAWVMPALMIIILLGFPVAIFYAWVRQIKFDDTGEPKPESISFPSISPLLLSRRGIDTVLVTLVISVLAGFALDLVPRSTADSALPSRYRLAVMPFEAGQANGTDNWLGKGVAEDLRNRLASFDALLVSSRNLSFRESVQDMDAQQLGHELNTQYLLRGVVVRGPDHMIVNARLIDAVTGFQLWADSFKGQASTLFDMQQKIVVAVANSLDIDPALQDRSAEDWPSVLNIAAYDSYLRGRTQLRDADDSESAGMAAAWYRQALSIDQHMPMARNGLCQAHVREIELSGSDWAYGKANQACAEAILQGPESVAAHLALANFYRVTGHAENAIDEYRWVADRSANNVEAWLGMARAHWLNGEGPDAEKAFRKALEIKTDDVDTHAVFTRFLLAEGRYGEAVEVARLLVQLDREQVNAYAYLAEALFMSGEFEAAIQASRQVLSRDLERHSAIMNIAHSYYYLGRYQRASYIYREASRQLPQDHFAAGGLANAYAQIDGQEAADKSLQSFARARQLAEAALLTDPADALTTVSLAYYCAALGDTDCAASKRVQALQLEPDNVDVHYLSALVHTRLGDMQAALAATQKALDLGYPQVLLVTDPQLEQVWSQRRFVTAGLTPLFEPSR